MKIHTSKTGKLAYTPGFLRGRGNKPKKFTGRETLEILFLLACMGLITGFVIGGADVVVKMVEWISGWF